MSFDITHQEIFFSYDIDGMHQQMSNVPMASISEHLAHLKSVYKRQIDILEYGSGVSTLWHGKSFPEAKIVSIEGNKEWYDRVAEWMGRIGIKNVDYRFLETT